MITPSQTKRALIDLLLAASSYKDGLRDVITGCADALKPAFDDTGGVCSLQFKLGAVILRAVENEDEEPVRLIFNYLDHETYVLETSHGHTWGHLELDFGWCCYYIPDYEKKQIYKSTERHLQE